MLSSDGRFASFVVKNGSLGKSSIKLVRTDGKWRITVTGRNQAFSPDGKHFLYINNGDSLVILSLKSSNIQYVPNVLDVAVSKSDDRSWINYTLTGERRALITRSLRTGKIYNFTGVTENKFISGDTKLLVLSKAENGPRSLTCTDLITGEKTELWTGKDIYQLHTDDENNSLAIVADAADNQKELLVFKNVKSKAKTILKIDAQKYETMFIERFSHDGKRIFLKLKENVIADSGKPRVNIWNYKDKHSQESQINNLAQVTILPAVVNVDDTKLTFLNTANSANSNTFAHNDNWDVNQETYQVPGRLIRSSSWLVSAKDGSSTPLELPSDKILVAPEFDFLLFFDSAESCFKSYNLATKKTIRISDSVPKTQWGIKLGLERQPDVAGWIGGEPTVLVYGKYDIWKLDLLGKSPAVNVTNGYGTQNKCEITLTSSASERIYNDQELLAAIFDTQTKSNGFYRINLRSDKLSRLLTIGPFAYYLQASGVENNARFKPIKANQKNGYLVQRQSSTMAPNYFYTTDFVSFIPMSDNKPEKCVNWYTTELMEWNSYQNIPVQGILYKPENFDPERKYPVVFYYYTKMSNNLNVYDVPQPSSGKLNISWYVSNGYLVFTPDVHFYYPEGEPWKNTYDCVISGAKYISQLTYVDSTRMGIQGISMGGMQTNYLITKTKIFAAACSGSSVGDFVSSYNGYDHGGGPSNTMYEANGKIGSLWDNPSWYLENSPVMNADKVTTPLLMFQTTIDDATPFHNALEFYASLRRLGKKVWLLEYNDGYHGVYGKDAYDFDLRMQQFFGHYLKGAPPPKWMTLGRPAKLKEIDPRLDLDLTGLEP